jgi:UPF0755 protein
MKKKIVFGILAVLIFLGAYIVYQFYGSAVSTPSGEFFYVKTGASYDEVKKDLVDKKYIKGSFWFDKASQILRFNTIKPGRYKMKKGMSLFQLVRMLRAGNQTPLNFVITKVRTREALASRVGNMFETDSLQMISFLNNADSLRPFGLDTNTVMVVPVPLTYSINWNSTPGKIFRQWHTAYTNFWTDARKQKAADHGMTPIQVSVLASIIDEETRAASDKPNIASVYINRIQQGMPLQADPTVKFALKNFALKRVLHAHLTTVSPYNTYINKGLPPGPICTPALETVDAVLNSPKTEYLYFVANSTFDGTHIFTTNYDDHIKYAKQYQKELTRQMKIRDSINKATGKSNGDIL